MPCAERLVAVWRRQRLPQRPPLSDAALRRFESMYAAALPPEMLAYLRLVDGMDADCTDANDIRFWPIAEIGPAEREGELRDCFEFADYLIDSHRYGVFVRGPRAGEVVMTGGYEPIKVADTFADFVGSYVDDVYALFLNPGGGAGDHGAGDLSD
ncbi:MAG TPA: SMI1/KNR4 family protein [Rhizomicrobium sp.]